MEISQRFSDSDQRRRSIRYTVLAEVLWDHRSREGETGEILDISPMGLFISADSGVLPDLHVGDVVWGVFRIGDHEQSFAATVRWRGYSQRHARWGVGVEFNDPVAVPADLLARFVTRHSLPSPG